MRRFCPKDSVKSVAWSNVQWNMIGRHATPAGGGAPRRGAAGGALAVSGENPPHAHYGKRKSPSSADETGRGWNARPVMFRRTRAGGWDDDRSHCLISLREVRRADAPEANEEVSHGQRWAPRAGRFGRVGWQPRPLKNSPDCDLSRTDAASCC